jgi:hypothetical protein
MSKVKILKALKDKGLSCSVCRYGWVATPEESIPAWEVQLDEFSNAACDEKGGAPPFSGCDLQEVMDWISDLPNLKT